MVLNAENVDGISIVEIPERLNSSNSKAFRDEMTPLMEKNSRFIFDMRLLNQVDSIGLGTIIGCLKHLRTNQGDLKVYGLSKSVRTLFQLVRLHHVVDIFNTQEEALASFK